MMQKRESFLNRALFLKQAVSIAIVLMCLGWEKGSSQALVVPLLSISMASDAQAWKTGDSAIATFVPKGVQQPGLEVSFPTTAYPNATYKMPEPSNGLGRILIVTLTNPGPASVPLVIQVSSGNSSDAYLYATDTIPAGVTATYGIPIQSSQTSFPADLQWLPSPFYQYVLTNLTVRPGFDPTRISSFELYLSHPTQPATLIIHRVGLAPMPAMDKLVDRYGQYTGRQWTNKIANDSDLISRSQEEALELRQAKWPDDWDAYGGWASGPQLPKAAFFRTAKWGDRWWLVTPAGHLFFAVGMDAVRIQNPTPLTGRERVLAKLPQDDPVLARHVSSQPQPPSAGKKPPLQTLDYYQANLERKYGPDYAAVWHKTTIARLKAWRFNLVGTNTPPESSGAIPYLASVSVSASRTITIGTSSIADPFDPGFGANVATALASIAAQVRNDPWCVGYVIDNELPWGSRGSNEQRELLPLAVMRQGYGLPAKAVLISRLHAAYPDIASLNAAWNTHFLSWSALNEPVVLDPHSMNQTELTDLDAFVYTYADQYFRTVRTELKKLDPNHLYMGSRFNNLRYTTTVVAAAAKSVDVISFNIYEPELTDQEFGFLSSLNKPSIVTEFHFVATDWGALSGVMLVQDQKARGDAYRNYLMSVLKNPDFVGCSWFRYLDEPLTGSPWNTENYNTGMVDIADTPYPMVRVVQKINTQIYEIRYPAGYSAPLRPSTR